MYMKHKI